MKLRHASLFVPLVWLALASQVPDRCHAAGGVQHFHHGAIPGKIRPGGPLTSLEGLTLRVTFRGITPAGEPRFSEDVRVPVSGDGTFEIPAGETKGELHGTRGRGWGEDGLKIILSLLRERRSLRSGASASPVLDGADDEVLATSSAWSYDDHVQQDTIEKYFRQLVESLHVRWFPGVAGRLSIVRSGKFPSRETAPGVHHPYRIEVSRGFLYGTGSSDIYRLDSILQGARISPDGSFRIEGGWELVPGDPAETGNYTGVAVKVFQREMNVALLEVERKNPSDEDLARLLEGLTAEERDIQSRETWPGTAGRQLDGDALRVCLAMHVAREGRDATPSENQGAYFQWFGDEAPGDTGLWFHHDGRRYLYYGTFFYDPRGQRLLDAKGSIRSSSGTCLINFDYRTRGQGRVGEWGTNRYCVDIAELALRCEAAIRQNPRFPVIDLTIEWPDSPGATKEVGFGSPAQGRLPFED